MSDPLDKELRSLTRTLERNAARYDAARRRFSAALLKYVQADLPSLASKVTPSDVARLDSVRDDRGSYIYPRVWIQRSGGAPSLVGGEGPVSWEVWISSRVKGRVYNVTRSGHAGTLVAAARKAINELHRFRHDELLGPLLADIQRDLDAYDARVAKAESDAKAARKRVRHYGSEKLGPYEGGAL